MGVMLCVFYFIYFYFCRYVSSANIVEVVTNVLMDLIIIVG
jgi:hypothetical protein